MAVGLSLFKVGYLHGYNNQSFTEKNVLAKDAAQAIEFATRSIKKNYISNVTITKLILLERVDIYYKS